MMKPLATHVRTRPEDVLSMIVFKVGGTNLHSRTSSFSSSSCPWQAEFRSLVPQKNCRLESSILLFLQTNQAQKLLLLIHIHLTSGQAVQFTIWNTSITPLQCLLKNHKSTVISPTNYLSLRFSRNLANDALRAWGTAADPIANVMMTIFVKRKIQV